MGENAAVAAARLELEEAEGAVQNILEQVKELESKQPSQSVSIHLYVLETRGIPSPFQAEVAIKHGSMHGDGAPILARGTFSSAGPVDPIELPGEMNSMALSIVVRGAATPPAEAAPEQASHDNGDDVGATAAAVVSDIVTGALSRVERNMVEVAVNFEIVAEEIVRFGTEQGEWAHSVAGDEQGLRLKIAVIREDSGPAIDSQLAEEIHAEFEAASTRTYAAKRALADLLEDQGQEERENQVRAHHAGAEFYLVRILTSKVFLRPPTGDHQGKWVTSRKQWRASCSPWFFASRKEKSGADREVVEHCVYK
jgi:hypothetical protein